MQKPCDAGLLPSAPHLSGAEEKRGGLTEFSRGIAASSVEKSVDFFHVIREEIQIISLVKTYTFLVDNLTPYLSINTKGENRTPVRLTGGRAHPFCDPRYPQMRFNMR
jgi:hypothetical protein